MDSTADQWPQDQIAPPSASSNRPQHVGERKVRPPQKDEILNCPRCHSTNTKFCYYNNYSLTQPRYFCKTCRRYWTAGGSLRNVPVGGGSRKNIKKSSQNPNYIKPHENQDLNLAFPAAAIQEYHGTVPQFLQVPKIENNNNIQLNLNSSFSSSSCSSTSTSLSAMELLKSTGINASRGLNNSFHIPTPMAADTNMMYTSGFPFQEFKPVVGFAVDGIGARYDQAGLHGNINQENNGAAAGSRLVFPFGAMSSKQVPSTNETEQNKGHGNPTLFWNGMSGGGSW